MYSSDSPSPTPTFINLAIEHEVPVICDSNSPTPIVGMNKENFSTLLIRCQTLLSHLQELHGPDHSDAYTRGLEDIQEVTQNLSQAIDKMEQQPRLISLLHEDAEENAVLIHHVEQTLAQSLALLNLEQTVENEIARQNDISKLLNKIDTVEQGLRLQYSDIEAKLDDISNMFEELNHRHSSQAQVEQPRRLVQTISQESLYQSAYSSMRGRPRTDDEISDSIPYSVYSSMQRRTTTRRQSWTSTSRSSSPPSQMSTASPSSSGHQTARSESLNMIRNTIDTLLTRQTDIQMLPSPQSERTRLESLISSPILSSPSQNNSDSLDPFVKSAILSARGQIKRLPLSGRGYRGALIEMLALPSHEWSFDKAIPLSKFLRVEGRDLRIVESRNHRKNSRRGERASTDGTSDKGSYDHILFLCGHDRPPTTIIIKECEPQPQDKIQAYVLNKEEEMTLVSVELNERIEWILIPYRPSMEIREAIRYIQQLFGRVSIHSCSIPIAQNLLSEGETFANRDIRPNMYSMKLRLIENY